MAVEYEYIGIVAIVGEEGTGKSSMGLTAPKPIQHMEVDVGGFARASWRFQSEIDAGLIKSKPYPKPVNIERLAGMLGAGNSAMQPSVRPAPKRVEGMREWWLQVVVDFVQFCQDTNIATIMVDSATLLWTICHGAVLQEAQDKQIAQRPGIMDAELRERLQPVEYGPANDRMRTIFQTARVFKKNLILTHYPTDVYGPMPDGQGGYKQDKTGDKKMDGFGETAKDVDLVVWTSIKEQKAGPGKPAIRYPVAKIAKCGIPGIGLQAVGMEVGADFESVMSLKKMFQAIQEAKK